MRSVTVNAALAAALVLQGCVTINIYFPAAAAEKAADKIIDEVWQLKKPGEPAAPSSTTPSPPPLSLQGRGDYFSWLIGLSRE